MREYNVKNIIFSSSATVYGDPAFVPITEECPKGLCTNPYGWSKSMLEQILMDIYKEMKPGILFCFVTSIQLEPIKAVLWERIQMESLTI